MKPWEANDTFLSRWLNEELTPEELQAFEASPDYADYVRTAKALDDFEVGDYDVFPQEFETFLFPEESNQQLFRRHHADGESEQLS